MLIFSTKIRLNCAAQFYPGSDAALAGSNRYIKINKYNIDEGPRRQPRMFSMRQRLAHDDPILPDRLKCK